MHHDLPFFTRVAAELNELLCGGSEAYGRPLPEAIADAEVCAMYLRHEADRAVNGYCADLLRARLALAGEG